MCVQLRDWSNIYLAYLRTKSLPQAARIKDFLQQRKAVLLLTRGEIENQKTLLVINLRRLAIFTNQPDQYAWLLQGLKRFDATFCRVLKYSFSPKIHCRTLNYQQ